MSDWPSNQDRNARGLPFNGTLGDGRHGNATLTTQTLTELIFQYGDLTINAGQTITAKAVNPGGLIVAVRGTLTLAGTITANGRGAPFQDTAVDTSGGYPGLGFAGPGGGDGTNRGGPIFIPGWPPFRMLTLSSLWSGITTATTLGNSLFEASMVGGSSTTTSAAVGADITGLFDYLWAFQPTLLLGYGGGGAKASGTGVATGGGCIFILCGTLNFTGTINANGTGGGTNEGGGGGGQVIVGYRALTANTGTINVNGGAGAGTGGAGASGYSKVFDMRM